MTIFSVYGIAGRIDKLTFFIVSGTLLLYDTLVLFDNKCVVSSKMKKCRSSTEVITLQLHYTASFTMAIEQENE